MGTEADNIVGTIQLTRSTSLVFSVSPWKGRMLAQVRKFVSGEKYEGPTPSGIVMGGEVLMSVIDALTQLKADAPGAKETQFAKVHKAGDTDIIVTVIPPDDLKVLPSVDVREYVDIEGGYSGPTKKGVRFAWDKLTEFIGLMEVQARKLGSREKAQPNLFADTHPNWVKQAEATGADKGRGSDPVLHELLPQGPKAFPGEFLDGVTKIVNLDLPADPISVIEVPGGKYAVQSNFGFRHEVRNSTEGNFIYYSHLRGLRAVPVPSVMIEVFRAVKAYENYVRELRHGMLKSYERKSGHRPMAEHQTKETFKSYGLPWLE